MSIGIRQALISDLETLVAFNAALAQETEQRVLNVNQLRSGVDSLLQDPSKGWYIVAESNLPPAPPQVVGQLLITFEWSDWRNGMFWWVQSVYVDPQYRRQGIFRQLYQYVYSQAQSQPEPICGVRLYVEQQNDSAHQVYASLGFQKTHYDMYEIEYA